MTRFSIVLLPYNNTATPRRGCYNLGLATTIVERVVIPYANSPWRCKSRYFLWTYKIYAANQFCKHRLRFSANRFGNSQLQYGQHCCPNYDGTKGGTKGGTKDGTKERFDKLYLVTDNYKCNSRYIIKTSYSKGEYYCDLRWCNCLNTVETILKLSVALREFASDRHVFCPKYMLNIGQKFKCKILLISGKL